MPVGKGGFKTVLLVLDTYSQHIWAFKFKKAGSVNTTATSLDTIFNIYTAPATLMSDNGTHFKNEVIKRLCEYLGTQQTFSPAHSPWVNGLVESTNKLLLYVLARLCAPDLGEDEWKETQWEALPRKWPTLLDRAVRILNWRDTKGKESSIGRS